MQDCLMSGDSHCSRPTASHSHPYAPPTCWPWDRALMRARCPPHAPHPLLSGLPLPRPTVVDRRVLLPKGKAPYTSTQAPAPQKANSMSDTYGCVLPMLPSSRPPCDNEGRRTPAAVTWQSHCSSQLEHQERMLCQLSSSAIHSLPSV